MERPYSPDQDPPVAGSIPQENISTGSCDSADVDISSNHNSPHVLPGTITSSASEF